MKTILEAQKNFYLDRPNMDAGNSVPFLIQAILDEAQELQEESPDYMSYEKYLEQEAVDVILFALALLRKLGVDPEKAVMEKIARNIVKYPAKRFLNGTPFSEAVQQSKAEWTSIRGNEDFYRDEKEEERKRNFDARLLLPERFNK